MHLSRALILAAVTASTINDGWASFESKILNNFIIFSAQFVYVCLFVCVWKPKYFVKVRVQSVDLKIFKHRSSVFTMYCLCIPKSSLGRLRPNLGLTLWRRVPLQKVGLFQMFCSSELSSLTSIVQFWCRSGEKIGYLLYANTFYVIVQTLWQTNVLEWVLFFNSMHSDDASDSEWSLLH